MKYKAFDRLLITSSLDQSAVMGTWWNKWVSVSGCAGDFGQETSQRISVSLEETLKIIKSQGILGLKEYSLVHFYHYFEHIRYIAVWNNMAHCS